jgi:hypothetical protein
MKRMSSSFSVRESVRTDCSTSESSVPGSPILAWAAHHQEHAASRHLCRHANCAKLLRRPATLH